MMLGLAFIPIAAKIVGEVYLQRATRPFKGAVDTMYPPEDLNAALPILVPSGGICVQVCELDIERKWCIGCGRTIEEIIQRGQETKSTRRQGTT